MNFKIESAEVSKKAEEVTKSAKKVVESQEKTISAVHEVETSFKKNLQSGSGAIKELTDGLIDLGDGSEIKDKWEAAQTLLLTPFTLANSAVAKSTKFFTGKEVNIGQNIANWWHGVEEEMDGEEKHIDGMKDKLKGKVAGFAKASYDALFANDPRNNPETGRFQKEVKGFFPKLTEAANSIKDATMQTFENLGDSISSAWSSMAQGVSNFLQPIKDSLSDAWGTMKDKVGDFATGMKEKVTDFGRSVLTGAKDMASGAWDYLKNTQLGQAISATAGKLIAGGSAAISAGAAWLARGATAMAGTLTAGGVAMTGASAGLLAGTMTYISGVWKMIATKLRAAIMMLAPIGAFLVATFSYIAGILAAVAAKLVAAAPFIAIGIAIAAAVALWIMAIMWVVNNFEMIKNYIYEKATNFIQGIKDAVSSIVDGFMNTWWSISDWVRGKLLGWKDWLWGLDPEEQAELDAIKARQQERADKKAAKEAEEAGEPEPTTLLSPEEIRNQEEDARIEKEFIAQYDAKITPDEQARIKAESLGMTKEEYLGSKQLGLVSAEQEAIGMEAVKKEEAARLATALAEHKEAVRDGEVATKEAGDINAVAQNNQNVTNVTQQIKDPAPHMPSRVYTTAMVSPPPA